MIISQTSRTEPRKARLRCARNHRAAGCASRASYHYEHLLNGILNEVLHLALPDERPQAGLQQTIAVAETDFRSAENRLDNLVDAFSETGSPALMRGITRAEREIAERRDRLEVLKADLAREKSIRPPRKAAEAVAALRGRIHEDEDARRKIHSALRELITAIFLYPDTREAHVLVAGVYALRFDGLGNLLDRQVATSAMIEGAHADNPMALARFMEASGIKRT